MAASAKYEVTHIFKRHGDAQTQAALGQIAITQSNFENVIDTIIAPDTVSSDNANGSVGIIFKKEIDGKVTAVTIMSDKKKALTLKSAWITKTKQSISSTVNANALTSTSETKGSMNSVSDNSVSKTDGKVNKKYALSSKIDS